MQLNLSPKTQAQLEALSKLQGISIESLVERAVSRDAYIELELDAGTQFYSQQKGGRLMSVKFRVGGDRAEAMQAIKQAFGQGE